jgi:general secretion pathway protein I
MGMLTCHDFSFSVPRRSPVSFRLPGSDNKQGFTLLEVMIAVSIIAISLVALFGSQSRSLTHATEAHFNIIAPMLASGKLAELKADNSAPNNDDGDFGDEFPGYTWEIETENANFDSPDVLGKLEKPLTKVELTVLWSDTRYSYVLTYYGHWQE